MEWLNYHHLYYFWTVAREGTVTQAAKELKLAPSTVSEQIHRLEESLGQPLFRKSGRNIVLTDVGHAVNRYAGEIFSIGRELQDYVAGRQMERLHLRVGLSMVIPKQIAVQLLLPALEIEEEVHLVCREGSTDKLLTDLALHHLDIVLTDVPIGPDAPIRAFNHLLGDCGVVFMATPELAERFKEGFPASLDEAPMLLPSTDSVLRRLLDRWFHDRDLHPRIVAEFDDSAMLKAFAARGLGVFAAPDAVTELISAQYGVVPIGAADGLEEHFYAISVHRRLSHPAVLAINERARSLLIGSDR